MIVHDKQGREIKISIYGTEPDDVQVDSAVYADDDSDVPDSVVDYIMDIYGDEIYQNWYEYQVDMAEYCRDSLEDR
jgi:hypothetical protein